MARIVGLLVLGLVLVMVGFSNAALFWLGIVGLALFVAAGFVGAMHPTVHPVEHPVEQPAGVGRRGGNHRASGSASTTGR